MMDYEQRQNSGRARLLAVADAFVCVALLLTLESLAVVLLRGAQFRSGAEMLRATGTLLPLGWLLAGLPAVLGAAWWSGLLRADDRAVRLAFGLCNSVLGAVVAYFVSSGRRMQTGLRRPIFILVVAVVSFLVSWFLSRWLARRWAGWSRRYRLLVLGAVLLAAEVLNQLLLPRLYPAFHMALAAATLFGATGAAFALAKVSERVRLALGLMLLLASAGGALMSPSRLQRYDNVRMIYDEQAPLLRYAVEFAAYLKPPPRLGGALADPVRSGPQEYSVDFRGADIVWISIDALRADHLGAYGYARKTTPFLDKLAREGVVFDAAYTPTPHTSYAVASLMTGKYMRPLLRQDVGSDSLTMADVLRRYDYRTAAFFPPAIFFVDRERFTAFDKRSLGFEYLKREFLPAMRRVKQVEDYLQKPSGSRRLFLWVHFFEPHEPYLRHPQFDYGPSSIDRYDSEVAAVDAALARLVTSLRKQRPKSVVVVTADHGEEFGDHGGRYHGTTVYDEQVRVPLIVHAPGVLKPHRVAAPVSLVDLMPTFLQGLRIPLSPRLRGRDIGRFLVEAKASDAGFAFSETDNYTLLAQADKRLICARKLGACRLFDTRSDPKQRHNVAGKYAEAFSRMKKHGRRFVASLGRFEGQSKGYPNALRRGIAGEGDAAKEVAVLLDDADLGVRRKAAQVLFELRRKEVAVQLRRALARDEDPEVKRWAALALTRLGQGAPLSLDLLYEKKRSWRRLAALALAEAGDPRGLEELIGWWRAAYPVEGEASERIAFERAKQIAGALGELKSKRAVATLAVALRDVRLRVHVANALSNIGDESARGALGAALAVEPYRDARLAIARALVHLGGRGELREPLLHFLGLPETIEGGVGMAVKSGILSWVGGPRKRERAQLKRYARSGVTVGVVVPKGGDGRGYRVVLRARSLDQAKGQVRFGLFPGGVGHFDRTNPVPKEVPRMDPKLTVQLNISASEGFQEPQAILPQAAQALLHGGQQSDFVIYATQNVAVDAFVVVPLRAELGKAAVGEGKQNQPQEPSPTHRAGGASGRR